LFAAFPVVYATVFSGFYLALMLLLVALIARAVSFEFRSKVESQTWRRAWDWAFGIGSLLPALLFGVAIGNILHGVPVDVNGNYLGSFLELLNPFSIASACSASSSLQCMVQSILLQKQKGFACTHCSMGVRSLDSICNTLCCHDALVMVGSPFLFESSMKNPFFFAFLILLIGTIVYLPIVIKSGKYGRAFLVSSLLITAMLGQMALSLFPRLVPSSIDLAYSLTVYNASSSPMTLKTMLIIALIGVPIVIAYSAFIHYVFRGKVEITEESY